jgi:hypothetical protein
MRQNNLLPIVLGILGDPPVNRCGNVWIIACFRGLSTCIEKVGGKEGREKATVEDEGG